MQHNRQYGNEWPTQVSNVYRNSRFDSHNTRQVAACQQCVDIGVERVKYRSR